MVSVVIIALAARNQLFVFRLLAQSCKPRAYFCIGSRSIITPVENGKTSFGKMPSSCAVSLQHCFASASPSPSVPALAIAALMANARGWIPAFNLWRHSCTGGAGNLFCVNIPATLECSGSAIIVKSSLPFARKPAAALPDKIPHTGKSLAGGGRLTGIVNYRRIAPPPQFAKLIPACAGMTKKQVPGAGVEPARHCWQRILSPSCIPISPSGHLWLLFYQKAAVIPVCAGMAIVFLLV